MNTKSYPVILTQNFFTLIADKDYSITKSDPRFVEAIRLYKQRDFDALLNLLDRPAAIERYSKGNVKVYDGSITFKGEPVHGVIADRILTFFKEGLPFEPLVAFLNNLYDNTSEGVRAKLYQFLEKNNLGITEDGNITVYKMVKADGSPPYCNGTFFEVDPVTKDVTEVSKYRVGHEYLFPRAKIREGSDECGSEGLYVGNKTYWGREFDEQNNYTGEGRLLIAEVRPQDVCNVAYKESSKMVVCRFKLVGEYKTLKSKVDKVLVGEDRPAPQDDIQNEFDGWDEDFDSLDTVAAEAEAELRAERLMKEVEANLAAQKGHLAYKPKWSSQAGRAYHNRRNSKGQFA